MRLLIGTPAYGGMLTTNYVQSLFQTLYSIQGAGVEVALYTITNEALISRGRNSCAQMAMEHGYDRLMFIDADIGWKWPDLERLLRSDKLVVGGTYPKKSLPISLNYNVFQETAPEFNNERKSVEDHELLKQYADPQTGELSVRHIPTGFMMIDTRVFTTLRDKAPVYSSVEPDGKVKEIHDFFPVRVHSGIMESEDWAFCTLCRENGIDVYLNVHIIVDHTGSYTFKP